MPPFRRIPKSLEKAAAPTVKPDLTCVPALRETVFNANTPQNLVRILSKGRRLGFTRSAKNFLAEEMLKAHMQKRQLKVMWVDTINSNIERYMQRYMLPIVRPLPQALWAWQKQEKTFHLGDSYIDYRSAESPENIEGFGYDLLILNEAGIILEDRYLFENAILPTTVDNPECIMIIGGTPKGPNLFSELHTKARSGVIPGWKAWTLSTYFNLKTPPYNGFLTPEGIQRLIDAYGGNEMLVRQEVFGEFVEGTEAYLLRFSQILDATLRTNVEERNEVVWGLDVGAHGSDPSVLTKRRGWDASDMQAVWIADHDKLAEWLYEQWKDEHQKPDHVVIEYNPVGWQLYNKLMALGITGLVKGDTASKNVRNRKVFNMRMQMYQDLADNLPKMRIADDPLLKEELTKLKYEMRENVKRLPPKEKWKAELGRSPDRSDSLALTLFKWDYLGSRIDDVEEDDFEMSGFGRTASGLYIQENAGFSF